MYEGSGTSKKDFIQQLIKSGASLANSDLRSLDLSGLDLSDADFEGADLSDAKMEGATISGANFKKTKMINVSLVAAVATRQSYFCEADMTNADCYRMKGTFANFRGAKLDKVRFEKASLTGAVFNYANCSKVDFRETSLKNTDWGSSYLISCDFRGADLTTSGPIDESHMPHRMRRTISVGSRLNDDTKMPESGLNVLQWDRKITRANRTLAAFAFTTALVAVNHYAPGLGEAVQGAMTYVSELVSKEAAGVILIASALTFGADFVQDVIKGGSFNVIVKAGTKIREFLDAALARGTELKNMVVAIGKTKSLHPIIKALESVKGKSVQWNVTESIKHVLTSTGESFVLCDKEHLARALAHISSNRHRGYSIPRDIILVRNDKIDDRIPSCIRFHKNGDTTVLWDKNGKTRYAVVYDDHGVPKHALDYLTGEPSSDMTKIPNASSLMKATVSFERELLAQAELLDFDYDREKNYITAGRDGTLMVHKISNRRLDNDRGPAVLIPEQNNSWERQYYRNSWQVVPESVVDSAMMDDEASTPTKIKATRSKQTPKKHLETQEEEKSFEGPKFF